MGVRLREKDEIKTFILYLLMQVEKPIDLATLNDIAVSDEFVNQFDFMDAFYELKGTDALSSETVDGTEYFSVTERGKAAAQLLEGNIVSTIRERSAYSATKLLSFSRNKAIARSALTEQDGKYKLSCLVSSGENQVLSVDLVLDSRGKAEKFRETFDTKPEFVYRTILSVLSGDINYLADSWIRDENYEEPTEEKAAENPEPVPEAKPEESPKKTFHLFGKGRKE